MLTKTSIIIFLMLITFSVGEKRVKEGNVGAAEIWSPRIPTRFQTKSYSRNVSFRGYILNGTPADIAKWKHKLSLRSFGDFFCGASVIGSQWALSAAHCLEYGIPAEYITLYGGSSSRSEGGVEFKVESYELHPEYNPVTFDCDAAVIKIEGSFDGHQNIQPAVLATEGCSTCPGKRVRLAGWGYNEVGILPDELHEIKQDIIDNAECCELWGGDITTRMLCANVENSVDSCDGDSGGAVMNGCLQVGIISFGSLECGTGVFPSVFTRIEDPLVRKFIRSRTRI